MVQDEQDRTGQPARNHAPLASCFAGYGMVNGRIVWLRESASAERPAEPVST
ncbi:hypothetical protein [Alteraurantiacibacter aquimixticola]|uniref:hypothetical protein n=1 Tax=Alteraurantiacibacter aquimixticola TaxID=2489173 RepID=UPI00145A1FF1|nr:hypothetical protein [Alteraurantiacibacter aquimixticola]